MAPKSDSVEGIVLNFVNEQNRPLNSQNVADALQKFSLKKTAVQKALDTLSDSGHISFKEYGKQKIYLARQDQFDIPNSEELDQMKKDNSKLQEELEDQKKVIGEVEAGPERMVSAKNAKPAELHGSTAKDLLKIRALQSNLTLEQLRLKEAKLKIEVREMEEKLNKLRGGTTLVKPEDRKEVQDKYSEKINQWRKRKRIFKDLWDSITENTPKDLKGFKEELGIEYDEDVGVNLQSYSELMAVGRKRKMGQ